MLILSRTIAPLTYLTIPKFSFYTLVVYKNDKLLDLIKTYTRDDNNQNKRIYMKRVDGLDLGVFFTETKGENVTVLNEKSPKEVFPYLFDQRCEYNPQRQKKWIAFKVLEKSLETEKTIGYIFIHIFKGIYIKRKVRNIASRQPYQPYRTEAKSKQVFFFIFIGERSYIQYIKTNIEVNSVKFPLELINMEWSMT